MTRKRIPARKETPDDHKWNLRPLLKNDAEWEVLVGHVEQELKSYAGFKGHLKDSLAVFKDAIENHLAITRETEKLYTYAHLKSDEDRSNPLYLGMYQRALNLLTRVSEFSSFLTPEIQSLPDEIASAYLEDEAIGEYRFYLQKILRYKPHTRNESEEQILAMTREVAGAPSQVFNQLDNVDLNFGTLEDQNGKEIELSHGNFTTFLINPHREIRRKAFFQYYQAYKNHQHTIAATLTHSLKKDLFYARVRHFEDCRALPLFADDVSPTVYDNLIETVKKNLAPLFNYLNFIWIT